MELMRQQMKNFNLLVIEGTLASHRLLETSDGDLTIELPIQVQIPPWQ